LSFAAVNSYAARPQPDACSRPWVAILQLVGVSLAGLARLGLATSLGGIVRSPRKVSLAQCLRQGNSGVTTRRDDLARLAERTRAILQQFERLRSQAAVTDRRGDQAVRAGDDGWCSRMMIKRAERQGGRLSDKVTATGCRGKCGCQRCVFELDAFGVLRKLPNSAVRPSRLRHQGAKALKVKSVCS